MRAVVDTNVLISAVIRPQGRVGAVLLQLRQKAFLILYSQSLLEELVNVLSRPRFRHKYGIGDDDIATVIRMILLRGEPVEIDEEISVCRDPRDNKFLEVAVAGKADVIVSGDSDLLVLHPFRGIDIIAPADFLTRLEATQS